MKTSIILFLTLLATSAAWAETACKTVEFPDHSEAICVGDEKATLDQNSPAAATRTPAIPNTTGNVTPQDSAVKATPDKTPAAQTIPMTSTLPATNEATTTRNKPETAAEHLARRKALAERTTRGLSSGTAPGSKQP